MLLRPASRIKGIKLTKGKKELTEESKGENQQLAHYTSGVDARIWTQAKLAKGDCFH